MRALTPPAPLSRCPDCGGELRLKRVERADDLPELQKQTLACADCEREQIFIVDDRCAGGGGP